MTSVRDSNGRFLLGTHWRPVSAFRSVEYLRREYIERGRSTGEIAAEHGVTDGAIIFWLRRHKIPRRTTSEVRSRKKWGAVGAANPMFGRTGEQNPRYVDGSSGERQRTYASSMWKAVRLSIYTRDGFRCRRCATGHESSAPLVAHHLAPWAGNPQLRTDESNLVTLCTPCHRWVHSRANIEKEWIA